MQNQKPIFNFCQTKFKTRYRRLSSDYASLLFEYCDEHSDFINQLAKKVLKHKYATKKNGIEDDQIIQIMELNAEIQATLSKNCPVLRFTYRCF